MTALAKKVNHTVRKIEACLVSESSLRRGSTTERGNEEGEVAMVLSYFKEICTYIYCVCVCGWVGGGGAETVHRVDVFPKRNDKPRIHVQETQFL